MTGNSHNSSLPPPSWHLLAKREGNWHLRHLWMHCRNSFLPLVSSLLRQHRSYCRGNSSLAPESPPSEPSLPPFVHRTLQSSSVARQGYACTMVSEQKIKEEKKGSSPPGQAGIFLLLPFPFTTSIFIVLPVIRNLACLNRTLCAFRGSFTLLPFASVASGQHIGFLPLAKFLTGQCL